MKTYIFRGSFATHPYKIKESVVNFELKLEKPGFQTRSDEVCVILERDWAEAVLDLQRVKIGAAGLIVLA